MDSSLDQQIEQKEKELTLAEEQHDRCRCQLVIGEIRQELQYLYNRRERLKKAAAAV